jgi:hypothetical protein
MTAIYSTRSALCGWYSRMRVWLVMVPAEVYLDWMA